MIRKISKIKNLGRFENFESLREFGKNTIIFGFNGTGKSTLSDLFYSLSKENGEGYLACRRTLNRDNECEEKKIQIEVKSDTEEVYSFSENTWNHRPENLYVFNERYIEEHVFVSRQIEGNIVPIMMGHQEQA